MDLRPHDPFGLAACEAELGALGTQYSDIYFDEVPFNQAALDDDAYLVVGRRGSGKTALAQYFSFQRAKPGAICVEVRKGEVYQEALAEVSRRTSESRAIAVANLTRVWEYIIWSLIGDAMARAGSNVKPIDSDTSTARVPELVADLIAKILDFFKGNDESAFAKGVHQFVNKANLGAVRKTATELAIKRPIFIAIDTLEQYDIQNAALMNALAALVEYASDFNLEYASKHIHLKVFVSGEVYPYMKEAVLLNPSKVVRHPVYLIWRAKDLLRLIGWRFYRYLEYSGNTPPNGVDWEDYDDVLAKVWTPHFGKTITNARNLVEDTWPYVLRHTQMRPRQLIQICNAIASRAMAEGTFPQFTREQIIAGVRTAEVELASEIVNSFKEIYPGVERILSALVTIDMMFQGNQLDRRAKESASAWPPGRYSQAEFRQLVAELGVIGRVARGSEVSGYIDAEFEYASAERLILTHRDMCVVHPMFYRKLHVQCNAGVRVMPFTVERL